jgi:hypothetical protein
MEPHHEPVDGASELLHVARGRPSNRWRSSRALFDGPDATAASRPTAASESDHVSNPTGGGPDGSGPDAAHETPPPRGLASMRSASSVAIAAPEMLARPVAAAALSPRSRSIAQRLKRHLSLPPASESTRLDRAMHAASTKNGGTAAIRLGARLWGVQREVEASSMFAWLDTKHRGCLDAASLHDGIARLYAETRTSDPPTHQTLRRWVSAVPKTRGEHTEVTRASFVSFVCSGNVEDRRQEAWEGFEEALGRWLVRRRLRRYKHGDTYTQRFLEVSGGDDFERVEADDVARALSISVKKARALCDVDKCEDGRVDHAGFVRIASSQRRCCSVERRTPHLSKKDLKKLFAEHSVDAYGEITGREVRVLLADVDHIERTAASLRSRQLFDVSSGASPLLLYDPEAFVDLVRSLRKCFSVDRADHVADKVRWRLARRGRPAPAPYEPPSTLGDVSSMVKRNDHRPSTRV